MKYSKEQVTESMRYLKDVLKIVPGDVIYTKVENVSRSGMSRNIKAYVIRDNTSLNISHSVATILETSIAKDGGVKMRGCGMDMGFALVYDLAYRLFPKRSEENKDGRYALKQRWM